MLKEYKKFNEETLHDALTLVEECFGQDACKLTRSVLDNPLLKQDEGAGCLGYCNGTVSCFQAVMKRKMYLGNEEIYGLVGGLTCKKRKGCPLSVLLETIERANRCSDKIAMTFGNSCCYEAAMMNSASGGIDGPESCACSLWRLVRPFGCAKYLIRRKLLKCNIPRWEKFSTLLKIDFENRCGNLTIRQFVDIKPEFFDVLMMEYVKSNEGIACSRTAKEIDWFFGERIRNGQCVLLAALDGNKPVGFIIVGADATAKHWGIYDWFAANNDVGSLEALLSSACVYLKKNTPAVVLTVTGFPSWIQGLLKRYLPFRRRVGHNRFSWNSMDKAFIENILPVMNSRKSWFFGPYDGDICR